MAAERRFGKAQKYSYACGTCLGQTEYSKFKFFLLPLSLKYMVLECDKDSGAYDFQKKGLKWSRYR